MAKARLTYLQNKPGWLTTCSPSNCLIVELLKKSLRLNSQKASQGQESHANSLPSDCLSGFLSSRDPPNIKIPAPARSDLSQSPNKAAQSPRVSNFWRNLAERKEKYFHPTTGVVYQVVGRQLKGKGFSKLENTNQKQQYSRDFPGGPVAKTHTPSAGARAWSRVPQLRACAAK